MIVSAIPRENRLNNTSCKLAAVLINEIFYMQGYAVDGVITACTAYQLQSNRYQAPTLPADYVRTVNVTTALCAKCIKSRLPRLSLIHI